MVNSKKIKLSDFVSNFIADLGVEHVFGVSGGASLHLIHSIADNPKLKFHCTHHEQGSAMAADGYSRSNGNIGVALSTSGPGATNLITGICCSFYDSVPVLFITGQVSTFRMTGDTGVRQVGFQETPILDICKKVTKYSVQINDPLKIRFELEKAIHIALSGRPGPVLIDIPDNIQREEIEPELLIPFYPPKKIINSTGQIEKFSKFVQEHLPNAKRPVIVGGWGIHLSKTVEYFREFIKKLKIPTVLTWGACDVLDADNPMNFGTFGTHGKRHANFAIQNSDFIISLGARLDTKATGSPVNSFGRKAKKVVVDIDINELGKFEKFGLNIDCLVCCDLQSLFDGLNIDQLVPVNNGFDNWINVLNKWKDTFAEIDTENRKIKGINPYEVMEVLSGIIPAGSQVFIDTGCAIAWAMQGIKIGRKIRTFHDFNNTAMGWALPASIGGWLAKPDEHCVCIIGDGSFMMTMQELSTVVFNKAPIKILLINNNGYSMIKQTQEQWLNSKYYASSPEGGLGFPDYKNICLGFNIKYLEINKTENLNPILQEVFNLEGSVFCNIIIPANARVIPQVKFGRPNEDMEPLLPRDIFNSLMLIK